MANPTIRLLTSPPPAEVIDAMAAVDGVAMVPTTLTTQSGPDGHLGPEAARALVVLQVTFIDEDGAAAFWRVAARLIEQLATAPGFIRRYSFADGPHVTLIALWRTRADADVFFASDQHHAAMRDLFRHHWPYSHFAGLWETAAPRPRIIFCPGCDGVRSASDLLCTTCGTELFDPFGPHAAGDHPPGHAADRDRASGSVGDR